MIPVIRADLKSRITLYVLREDTENEPDMTAAYANLLSLKLKAPRTLSRLRDKRRTKAENNIFESITILFDA